MPENGNPQIVRTRWEQMCEEFAEEAKERALNSIAEHNRWLELAQLSRRYREKEVLGDEPQSTPEEGRPPGSTGLE